MVRTGAREQLTDDNSTETTAMRIEIRMRIRPNDPDHRPRASEPRHGTETQSRGSVHPACPPLTEAEPTIKIAKDSIPRTHHPRGPTHRLSPSPSVFRPESVWSLSQSECSDSPHTDSGRNTDWHRDGDPRQQGSRQARFSKRVLGSLLPRPLGETSIRTALTRVKARNTTHIRAELRATFQGVTVVAVFPCPDRYVARACLLAGCCAGHSFA